MFFPYILYILTLRFKAPRSKHRLLVFSPVSSPLLSSHLYPLLCSQLMQRVMAVLGEGEGNEYLMAFLITKRCPAAMVILTNTGKIQKNNFHCLLISLRGKKLYKKNNLFCLFLVAHYVAKAYMSNIFYYGLKCFSRTFPVADSGLAVSTESPLLPVISPLQCVFLLFNPGAVVFSTVAVRNHMFSHLDHTSCALQTALHYAPVAQNHLCLPWRMGHVSLPLTNNNNCGFEYLEVEKNGRQEFNFHIC